MVECPRRHLLTTAAPLALHHAQRLQPAPHLPGALVGEGDRQNLPRQGPQRLDQVGHAVGQHERLARPRAGQHPGV